MYIVCCGVNYWITIRSSNIVNSSLYRFLQLAGLTYRSLSSNSSMEQWCDLQTQQPKAHFWGLLSNKTCYHDSFIIFLHSGFGVPELTVVQPQKNNTKKVKKKKKTPAIRFTAAPVEHCVTQQQQQTLLCSWYKSVKTLKGYNCEKKRAQPLRNSKSWTPIRAAANETNPPAFDPSSLCVCFHNNAPKEFWFLSLIMRKYAPE